MQLLAAPGLRVVPRTGEAVPSVNSDHTQAMLNALCGQRIVECNVDDAVFVSRIEIVLASGDKVIVNGRDDSRDLDFEVVGWCHP